MQQVGKYLPPAIAPNLELMGAWPGTGITCHFEKYPLFHGSLPLSKAHPLRARSSHTVETQYHSKIRNGKIYVQLMVSLYTISAQQTVEKFAQLSTFTNRNATVKSFVFCNVQFHNNIFVSASMLQQAARFCNTLPWNMISICSISLFPL